MEFGTGQVLWSIFWFFLFVIWFWLLITVFGDIMRDRSTSGWTKALWVLAIIILPYLGIFIYLIVNGNAMGDRNEEHARAQANAMAGYYSATPGTDTSSQLSSLASLHSEGKLTDSEFEAAKARVVNG